MSLVIFQTLCLPGIFFSNTFLDNMFFLINVIHKAFLDGFLCSHFATQYFSSVKVTSLQTA